MSATTAHSVQSSRSAVVKDDVLTAIAIGVMGYAFAVLLHEGIGHGSLCALSGAANITVTTAELQCSVPGRAIAAGGPLSNLVVGAILLAVLRASPPANVRWRFFLWFAQGYNLFMAAGYFLFSGISGIGDWAVVFAGVEPAWLVRAVVTVVGALLYFWFGRLSALALTQQVVGDCTVPRLLKLSLVPYLAAAAAAALAALMSADGTTMVLVSALPSSLGGGVGFAWMVTLVPAMQKSRGSAAPTPLQIGWGWIAVGIVVAIVFVAVFGPGVTIRTSS